MFEYCREPPKIESARTGDEIEDECNWLDPDWLIQGV
jgi:hypothetical protein